MDWIVKNGENISPRRMAFFYEIHEKRRQNARPFSGSFCRALFRRLRLAVRRKAVATTTAPSILDQAPQFNATIEKVAPIPVPTEQASSQGNQKYRMT